MSSLHNVEHLTDNNNNIKVFFHTLDRLGGQFSITKAGHQDNFSIAKNFKSIFLLEHVLLF
jgi:hypothetical protein